MVAQVIKKNIEKIEYREKNLFWTLFSIFALFLFLYGYFVNSAILHAVHKQQLEAKISSLNTNINTLEFQYLGMKNNVTLDLALVKGFVKVPATHFALLTPNQALSVNEN